MKRIFGPRPQSIFTFPAVVLAARRFLGVMLLAVGFIPTARAQLNLPAYYGTYPPVPVAGQWSSTNVFYSGGYLAYVSDAASNRIADFSYAGYHYGEKALPTVAVVNTLGPVGGDETARLQAALDAIGALPLNANGHRGTLLLLPGTYEIWGTLRVRQSGVVLRGSGNGTNPGVDTILFARGNTPHQRTVVIVGSNSGSPWSTGSAVNITNQFVPVGSLSVEVANAAAFSVGQDVQIRHPSSQAWIDALAGGGVVSDAPWTAGSKDLRWIRRIVRKEGARLFLDAPIYNHLDRSLVQATIMPITSKNLITEAGVENLRIDIETLGGEDENHAWNAIGVVGADNCWVQNCNLRYFGYGGVRTSGAIRITVKNCRATDPVAIRTGGRMYNFVTDSFSQLILFTGCHAGGARHSFISNGTTTVGGAVWHRCTMNGGDFEGHRHWSQGMLLDTTRELGSPNSQAKLINRGDYGTSHGWGAAHSVIWGFNKEMTVQRPPTAQNYGVSSEGTRRSSGWFPGPLGSIEIKSGPLVPQSLYEAQLCDRLAQRPVFLIARHSGKALGVAAASPDDGASIIQSATNTWGENGEWFLVGFGGGYTRIIARHSSKDMTVAGASIADDANIVQGTYLPAAPANDEWQIVPVTNEFYRVVNRLSGKVLGVTNASTADGALVQQMTWTGATHQQFRIQARPAVFSAPVPLKLSATPPSQLAVPGNAVAYTITVESTLAAPSVAALVVTGLPANTFAAFNPATVTNSGASQLTVTTTPGTPLGNYPLTITGTASTATNATLVSLIVSSNYQAAPGVLLWTGGGGGAVSNWNTFQNWTNVSAGGLGSPGPQNHVVFGNAGTKPPAGELSNVADDDFTISSLLFTNTSGRHTTLIESGRTLTITGSVPGYQNSPAVNVGMETHGGNADVVRAAITGESGTLVLNNPAATVQIRQGFGSGTVGTYAELDLSGLGTFSADLNRIQLGAESGTPRRVAGILRLARDNHITLAQPLTVNAQFTSGSPALYLGHNTQAGNSLGSAVYLGINNVINVNYVVIGRGNQTGNLLAFNPAFLGDEPGAQFRASDGTGRVGLWLLGDNSPGSLTTPSSGTNDFSGGTIDVLVDKMFIGRGRLGNTANTGIGMLTFDAGTINVNELRLGTMVDEASSTNASGIGIANVNGDAVLIVNEVLDLAHTNTTAPATAAAVSATRGTLNVNGGMAVLHRVIAGGGVSTLNVSGGTVILNTTIGSPAAALNTVNLTDATLRLKVNGAVPFTNVITTTLATAGVNIIGIDAVTNVTATTVFPLFSYGTLLGAGNFTLGDLPEGFAGGLVDHAARQTIDLVLTPLAIVAPQFVTVEFSGANLNFSGANGAPHSRYTLLATTNLALPLAAWARVVTNYFDAQGDFTNSHGITLEQPQQFYVIQMP